MAVLTIQTTLKSTRGKASYCYSEHIALPADIPVFMTSRTCNFVSQLRVVTDHQTNAMLIQFNGDSPLNYV